ncbi:MAG: membrane protein insertase YidC [Planctomycetes bacterium]|nr:membrane protein insertase YidC [Planctomycetota bacterium]
MDKKTFVHFLLMSVAIIVGWYVFLSVSGGNQQPHPPAREQEAERPQEPEETEEQPVAGKNEKGEKEPQPIAATADVKKVSGIVLQNKNIQASWTNTGAGIEFVKLRKYKAPYFKTKKEKERPVLTLVRDFQKNTFSDVITSVSFHSPPDDAEMWGPIEVDTENLNYRIVESENPNEIVFEAQITTAETTHRGLQLNLRKIVTIDPDTHHVSVRLQFINPTDKNISLNFELRSAAGIERENMKSRYLGAVVGRSKDDEFDISQTDGGKTDVNKSTNIQWAGVMNQYFVALSWPTAIQKESSWIKEVKILPVTDTHLLEATGRWKETPIADKNRAERREVAGQNATVLLRSTVFNLAPKESASRGYRFITCPKLKKPLGAYGEGLTNNFRFGTMPWITNIISLGTLPILTPLMVWILEFFHGIIPNYGIALLLLTLLVRSALHPLTKRSQISMHKVKLLQPRIKALQSKYGDDQQKIVQEQMKLYREYGAHPLSGCWPMLLQMPVFISLFTTLRTSIQLRQATFIPGWIEDLSQSDTVWHLPWNLPIMGNELNILPFIMVAMWMLNQHLMPKPQDERAQQQQKFMKWMPVLFAVIFYRFASGLVLYITASSGFGALQHWYIRRHIADMELKPVDEGEKEKSPDKRDWKPKEKGLLGKLMDHLEEQQKKSKQAKSSKKNNDKD